MVDQARSRRADVPEGRTKRGYLWLRCDGLRIGRCLFAPRTWTSDNYGKMCGAQKVWILPCCRKPTPGMGGLRDRLKSRILPFLGDRYFSHSVAVLWEGECCSGKRKSRATPRKAMGRREGGGGHRRPGRKESMDAVQGRGFLSGRGWRSGREPPEKEKWFNYASGGGWVRVGRLTEMFKLA